MFEIRKTRPVWVGNVQIGGGAPVSIQSMTNTDSRDARATLDQIFALQEAGCELVRVAIPDMQAAEALRDIVRASPIPVAADIHFDHRLALAAIAAGAHKIRINPSNIGSPARVKLVADACREAHIPIRIGVNGGSLSRELIAKYGGITPEALLESALTQIEMLEKFDFYDIIVAIKCSDVAKTMRANRLFAERCDVPLHVGLTEAGTIRMGTIKSSAAIGGLLAFGIGETIRVSLTDDPVREVELAKDILAALGLRRDRPEIVSCPTCGRTRIDLIGLAKEVETKLFSFDRYIKVAVMGCAVNGPGEARDADIGIAGGDGDAVLFVRGEVVRKLTGTDLADQLVTEIMARF